MTESAHIFPGIYFETVQEPLQDTLPRMDIASFVGLASAGPLHIPVAVESAQQFRDIFGADLSLAWDNELNHAEQSYLGLSVETFFRNGGRRCWVVRVADEEKAQTANFQIPGMIRTNGEQVETAFVTARSPGNWAAQVELKSVLQIEQLQLVTRDALSSTQASLQLQDGNWYVDVIANQRQLQSGDLINIYFSADTPQVYLYIESISAIEQGLRLSGSQGYLLLRNEQGSPPEFDPELAIPAQDGADDYLVFKLADLSTLGMSEQWPSSSPQIDQPSIKRLRFELLTRGPDDRRQRISNLGFCQEQTRFFGLLPSDQHLFQSQEGRLSKKYPAASRALREQVTTPRFAVAATDDAEKWHYLPTNMSMWVEEAEASTAQFTTEVERLQREGLQNFGARVFLDERLQDIRSDMLKQEANTIAFLSESQSSSRLKGIHSLLLLEEATIVAVPDAIHRRWDALAPNYELPLAAPELLDISETANSGEYEISWSQVSDVIAYTLEWSLDADFGAEVMRSTIRGDALPRIGEPLDLVPQPASEQLLTFKEDCPAIYYFRVRAEGEGEVSGWSNYKAKLIPNTDFLDCRYANAPALELWLEVASGSSPMLPYSATQDGYLLQWDFTGSDNEAAEYFELQRASDRLFSQSEIIFSNVPGSVTDTASPDLMVTGSPDQVYYYFIDASPDSTYYYRVRAIRNDTSGPWSNTLTLWPSQLSRTTLQPLADFSNADLLAIHRALLRCCSARGDLFGVLSLPKHYQVQDALEHYARLKPTSGLLDEDESSSSLAGDEFGARVAALSQAEEAATSHGALYYPWLAATTESHGQGRLDVRVLPPDGSVVGSIAARSMKQGSWIAPANIPLTDVLALNTRINDAQWARLTESRINVIRQAVNGFLLLSANTLSTDSELGSINVRRLLSLLLRLALREGNRYVFEPNNALFHERVQQHFETLFARMYERGAFAGKTPSQAYQVITDSSINTIQSINAGRFIVELRVAPSRALKFIRVRLLQSGPSQLQVQEV